MPQPATAQHDDVDEDTSTRQRLLVATAEVLARKGMTKLSLSEVALQAGVSRPTLYRWFASKEELLDAFGGWERTWDPDRRVVPAPLRPAAPTDDAELRARLACRNGTVRRRKMVSPEPQSL